MKELVVISGKGGTGKTSLTASFCVMQDNAVLADCDVDAADLHLILSPDVKETQDFYSGSQASIRQNDCISCGACLARCRFEAIVKSEGGAGEASFSVNPYSCEGCGVCVDNCPVNAIDFPEQLCGKLFLSDTRCGPMVHARLGIAAENSGKLVAKVRSEAKRIAEEENRDMIIVDGPPGIGCPVIASVGGVDAVLIVTEPTLSGKHDLDRVLDLAKHFGIKAMVCINKFDLNPEMAAEIEARALERGAEIAGRVRYHRSVTDAQIKALATVELEGSPVAEDIRSVWEKTKAILMA